MAAPAEFFSFHETDIDTAQAAVGESVRRGGGHGDG